MANPAHLEKAKKGTRAVALWGDSHFGDSMDLIGANLNEADLTGASLTGPSASRPPGGLTRCCPRPLMARPPETDSLRCPEH